MIIGREMMSAAAAMIMGTLVIAARRQLPNLGST
jgi:hypothetical protein